MPNPYHLTSNPDPNHASGGHSVEAPRGGLSHLILVRGVYMQQKGVYT